MNGPKQMPAKDKVIVSFPVTRDGGHIVERMHACDLGGGGRYILDNSPFYAYGISHRDVFLADLKDGDLTFVEVVFQGGHSTYRIRLREGLDHNFFLEKWLGLERLQCTYEGSSSNAQLLYSIDVPPGADVTEVYRLLEYGESEGYWTFEEGHYFSPS
jgi:hypothetical protein